MSSLHRPDPLVTPTRELRRLHVAVVPTAYISRDAEEDASEAQRALAERRAFEDGYALGLAEAQVEIERMKKEDLRRVSSAVSALERAVSELVADADNLRREMQASASRLAFAIVEQLFSRELQLAVNPGRDAIIRTLALDESTAPVTVRLNPEDFATLGEVGDIGLNRQITVIADPLIAPGGAVAETGSTTLDGQLSTALERVREILVGGPRELSDDRVA